MHFESTRMGPSALIGATLHLVAIVEVESHREEMDPTFPERFAAAVDEVHERFEETVRDGLDLQNFAPDSHVPWIAAQMAPSEGPLDGTWF